MSAYIDSKKNYGCFVRLPNIMIIIMAIIAKNTNTPID